MSLMTKRVDLIQGETFRMQLYWYRGVDVVKSITAATNDYPSLCTSTSHGLPTTSDVPVTIIGPEEWLTTKSTAKRDRIYAKALDANTFTVPIDATDELAYGGGNSLIYTPPVDMTGMSARMQVRSDVDSTVVLMDFTTENNRITLYADGHIDLMYEAADTEDLTFSNALGDLEVVSGGTDVTRVARIHFRLIRETTRPV